MESTLEVRFLLEADIQSVQDFSRSLLEKLESEPMDIEMKSWVARWRPESLTYYIPQGWSLAAFDGSGRIQGYILAQPILFFRGLTQTLWLEEFLFANDNVGELLLETTFKWARDKHLQCVLMESAKNRVTLVQNWKQARELIEPMIELRSSRYT